MKAWGSSVKTVWSLCLLALTLFAFGDEIIKPEPIAPGEHVIFYGDSITGTAWYASMIQLFVADRKAETVARGVPGDNTSGALLRFDLEILSAKPDRVFLMFGMNDFGINLYQEEDSNPEKRAEYLEKFKNNTRKLVNRLQKAGIKPVLMTVTPYNQYGEPFEASPITYPFANSIGLASFAKAAKELGAELKVPVIDLYTPLTAVISAHPAAKLWRWDRVHPDLAGHYILAAEILKACGESPVVGSVRITGSQAETVNAKVTDLKRSGDDISYTYLPRRLPLAITANYKIAKKSYPLAEALNQEILQITDLPDGEYRVAADNVVIGEFTGKQLRDGINLAEMEKAPGQRQAVDVLQILQRLRRNEMLLTAYSQVRLSMMKRKVDLNDPEAVEAELKRAMDEAVKRNLRVQYTETIHKRFRMARANLQHLQSEAEALRAEVIAKSEPQPCRISITSLSNRQPLNLGK